MKVLSVHSSTFAPLERDNYHTITNTPWSTNPSAVKPRTFSLEIPAQEAHQSGNCEKQKSPHARAENDIWTCKPIAPAKTELTCDDWCVEDMEGIEGHGSVEIHVHAPSDDGESEPHRQSKRNYSWMGPRRVNDCKPYTEAALHVSRSEMWLKYYKKLAEKDRQEAKVGSNQTNESSVPTTDENTESICSSRVTFTLGSENTSFEDPTPEDTTPIRIASSQTSFQSITVRNDSIEPLERGKAILSPDAADIPAMMHEGCPDLRELEHRLREMHPDRQETADHRQTFSPPLTSFSKASFNSDSKCDVCESEQDTSTVWPEVSAFRRTQVLSQAQLKSIISEEIQHAQASRGVRRSKIDWTEEAVNRYFTKQRERQHRLHPTVHQAEGNCESAIASDSEYSPESEDMYDMLNWDAPLTPRFGPNLTAHQATDHFIEEALRLSSRDTVVDSSVEAADENAQEQEISKQQIRNQKALECRAGYSPIEDGAAAVEAANQAAAKSTLDRAKCAETSTKMRGTECGPNNVPAAPRQSKSEGVKKQVRFAETSTSPTTTPRPIIAPAKTSEARAELVQNKVQDTVSNNNDIKSDACLRSLPGGITRRDFTRVGTTLNTTSPIQIPPRNTNHMKARRNDSTKEITDQNGRGPRWTWNYVVPELDHFRLEALKQNPRTSFSCLADVPGLAARQGWD